MPFPDCFMGLLLMSFYQNSAPWKWREKGRVLRMYLRAIEVEGWLPKAATGILRLYRCVIV